MLRADVVAGWIAEGCTYTTMVRKAAEEWGLAPRFFDKLHRRANLLIVERINRDRPNVLAEKLAQLEHVIQESSKDRAWSATVGALSLFGKWAVLHHPPQG
jgi:hypothetical protein